MRGANGAGVEAAWLAPARHRVVIALLFSSVMVLGAVAALSPATRAPTHLAATASHPPRALAGPGIGSGMGPSGLSLGISVTPGIICVTNNIACPGNQQTARVTMEATAPTSVTITYPAVQVIFLLETTAYDGTYDGSLGVPGREYCADSSLHQPCEESNGVPFFVAHAGDIASTISSANPRSSVTFGLVDFFSTGDAYDKFSVDTAQGLESVAYHVDVGAPVSASNFESAVTGTFQQQVLGGGWVYPGLNFGNNILHSDSITALYGALMGEGIAWVPNAHHVIILIGSTAPRDPSFIQNYCVSPSAAWRFACFGNQGDFSSPCEPSYNFGDLSSPNCLGWTQSQNGDPNATIAGLAHWAPNCLNSLGGRCTIDTISLWTTPTDPYSPGWPGALDAGPGGPLVVPNTIKALTAACDMARATGGSWDGPSFFACAGGGIGDLQFVPHGPDLTPNLGNPSLLSAFHGVSFGPLLSDVIARGGNESMFRFVPFANVRPAPDLQMQTTCGTPNGVRNDCPGASFLNGSNYESLNWNWSNTPAGNVLHGGDTWTASFNVIALGPPYRTVPVDACTTAPCAAGGSGPVGGTFTATRYFGPAGGDLVQQSFPIALIRIIYGPEASVPSGTPPPPAGILPAPVPPGLPLAPAPAPLPVSPTSIASLSVQALGAGFLGAGFTRVAMKNRPVAVGQVNLSGNALGKRRRPPSRPVGRFV
jgi:hypothetical protein